MFEKFYQVDKWYTGNIEGIGLGLAIVKHVVDAYDGSVRVESEMNKGARLALVLPGQ